MYGMGALSSVPPLVEDWVLSGKTSSRLLEEDATGCVCDAVEVSSSSSSSSSLLPPSEAPLRAVELTTGRLVGL
jgi:hypothetical protein